MKARDERNALERCELAEKFTSPNTPPPPREIYAELQRLGLIHFTNGMRLTEAGRARLAAIRA